MRFIRLALTALAMGPALSAQPHAPSATASSGFSTARLARVDTFMQRYVDDGRIAGAVGLVLRDGKVVYEHAVGWADRESGRKMTPDIIFRIASQSKAITSVAVLQLVEQGKVAISDRVSRFIPAFERTTVASRTDTGLAIAPARRPITIRDLLTHTAGISYGTEPLVASLYRSKGLGPAAGFGWYTADKNEPICDTMERLASLPFAAQPGDAWVYGYNTDILGCVVERASGQPLDVYVRENITGPLGMKDTHFFLPPGKRARLASVYRSDSSGHAERAPDGPRGQGDYVEGPRRSFAGGAGIVSTAADYARFLEAIRRGGAIDAVRILSPHAVELMRTNMVGSLHAADGGLGFGLGFETVEKFGASGMASAGAFGWGGAYASTYKVDPRERLVIVFMIQLMPNGTDIAAKFPTLVYQALSDAAR
jgi:CubicO group peptidase (beta-lactamase class C family)